MKVDSHIVHAIEQFMADKKIGCDDFAKSVGVSSAAVTKWRKVGCGITNMRWQMVFSMIRKYLPEERMYIDDAGREQYSSASAKQSSYFFEPKYIPLMVPTFTMNEIANYDDTLESITQFGARLKVGLSEYRPKHKEKSSVFAISLSDDKLGPVLPNKTKLFVCAGERPSGEGMVAVLPVGQQPFIGKYKRTGDEFEITGVSSDRFLNGKVKDAKRIITWTYPVLYYEVITF